MKILFCASRASHILNFHLPYLEYYKNRGWRVDVLTQGDIPPPLCDICHNIKFQKNLFSPSNISNILKISKILKDENYDIITTHTTLAGFMVRAAAMLSPASKSYLVHISHGYLFGEEKSSKTLLYRLCEQSVAKTTDCLLTMNKEDMALAEKYRLCKNLHYISGMGLQTERLMYASDTEISMFRRSLNLDSSDFVFACVGEFSERKNQRLILEALSLLKGKAKNIRVLFAGTGQTLDFCRDEAERLELSQNVRFLGQVQNTSLVYRACSAVISASLSEGLPFNIMEALFCRCPIIASRVKGHTDLLNEGENALLFESKNALELSEQIERLVFDSSLYNSLRENAFLPEKYTIQEVLPVVVSYYNRTVPSEQPVQTSLHT